MAIFSNSIIPAAAAAADDDVITKSVRFNRADDPYISFTPSSTGDQKKWTTAMWIKRSAVGLSTEAYFGLTCDMHSGETNNGVCGIYFGGGDDKIDTYFDTDTPSNPYGNINDRVYRDPASWMQIIWAVDAANTEQRIWVNGVEETASSSLNPPDYAYAMNKSGHLMAIGTSAWGVGNCFDGYIAQVVHLDGKYITDPTEFGQFSSTTGEWEPIEITSSSFSGDFGTNGALLEFKETGTGTPSSSTIGADTSGNDNHWSVSSGIDAEDVMEDTPTDNYCVLNELDRDTTHSAMSEGNLSWTTTSYSDYAAATSGTIQIPSSGKWYFEFRVSSVGTGHRGGISITNDQTSCANAFGPTGGWNTGGCPDNQIHVLVDAYSGGFVAINARVGGSDDSTNIESIGTGNYIMSVAIDSGAKKLWARRDGGSWYDSGDPANGTDPNATWTLDYSRILIEACNNTAFTANSIVRMNFGADPTFQGTYSTTPATSEFAFSPPTNFKALSTGNLPTPTIAKPSEHFDIKTWTATSTNPKVLDFPWSFASDDGLVWQKMRNSSGEHYLFDTVRGDDKALYSSTSDVEQGYGSSYYTQDFDSSGDYSIQQDGAGNEVNDSPNTYVAWGWKESDAAGFDIITWTGNAEMGGTTSQAVDHDLDVVPEMVIAKCRSTTAMDGGDWIVYHKDLSHSSLNKYLVLNETDGETEFSSNNAIGTLTDSSITFDNDLAMMGGTSRELNVGTMGDMQDASTYVAYVFASVAGMSSFGSWTGTGSASTGPFIYTGFRPALVIHKEIDTDSYNWVIHDSARDPDNDDSWKHIIADLPEIENGSSTGGPDAFADFLSNGFKINSGSTVNGNGTNKKYIYGAWAESPIKSANAR